MTSSCTCCHKTVNTKSNKPAYDIPKPKNELIEIVSTAKIDMKNFIEWSQGISNVHAEWTQTFDDGSSKIYSKPLRFFKPSSSESSLDFLNRIIKLIQGKEKTTRENIFIAYENTECNAIEVLELYHSAMISSLISHQTADDAYEGKDADYHIKACLNILKMAKDPLQQMTVDNYTPDRIKYHYIKFFKDFKYLLLQKGCSATVSAQDEMWFNNQSYHP